MLLKHPECRVLIRKNWFQMTLGPSSTVRCGLTHFRSLYPSLYCCYVSYSLCNFSELLIPFLYENIYKCLLFAILYSQNKIIATESTVLHACSMWHVRSVLCNTDSVPYDACFCMTCSVLYDTCVLFCVARVL